VWGSEFTTKAAPQGEFRSQKSLLLGSYEISVIWWCLVTGGDWFQPFFGPFRVYVENTNKTLKNVFECGVAGRVGAIRAIAPCWRKCAPSP
jgi:hypothetical protein